MSTPCKRRRMADPGADRRVCAKTCRIMYGMSVDDLYLYGVDCDLYRNPYYGKAAPMRLYWESRVQVAAAQKAQDRRIAAEEAAVRAVQKYHDAVAAKDRDAVEWSEWLARPAWSPATRIGMLPYDVMEIVAEKLAKRADGVVCVGSAARDLCNYRTAVGDAALAGFDTLRAGLGQCSDRTSKPLRVDKALHRDLHAAARAFGLQLSGVKSELGMRVVRFLRLASPTPIDASIPAAVAKDRTSRPTDVDGELFEQLNRAHWKRAGCAVRDAHDEFYSARTLRDARVVLRDAFGTLRAFKDAIDAAPLPVQSKTTSRCFVAGEIQCACGQAAAVACVKRLCRFCCAMCPGACARHDVG